MGGQLKLAKGGKRKNFVRLQLRVRPYLCLTIADTARRCLFQSSMK
jgi:hypothetical protein